MEFQSLDIDKYINWYFKLSLEIELLPINKVRANEYALSSFYLFQRHVINSDNKKSLALSEIFANKGKEFQKRVDEVKIYQTPEFKRKFLFPTVEDWSFIRYTRPSFIEQDIKGFEEKRLNTPLPEQDFIKHTLKKWVEDRPIIFLNQYINVQPLPSGCALVDFVHDINTIDFVKYLETEIKKLEATKSTGQRLIWESDKKDITELIKALSLTALASTPETEIIKVFETVFSDGKGNPLDIKKRYEVNKNELQDRKPSEMFTSKMSKAIEEFLKKKYQ